MKLPIKKQRPRRRSTSRRDEKKHSKRTSRHKRKSGIFQNEARKSSRGATVTSSNALLRRADRLEQLKKRQKQAKFKNIAVVFGVIICAIWVIMYGRISGIEVQSLSGDALSSLEQDRIIEASENYFKQTSKWRFAFSDSTYNSYLGSELPELQDVQSGLSIFSTKVAVSIDTGEPVIFWQSAGRVYGVNNRGVVISINSSDIDTLERPIVFDDAGLTLKVGDRVASSSFTQFMTDSALASKQSDFTVESVKLESSIKSLRYEIDGAGYSILLSTDLEPAKQWSSARDLLTENIVSPQEYIDLRIPGRVFWK